VATTEPVVLHYGLRGWCFQVTTRRRRLLQWIVGRPRLTRGEKHFGTFHHSIRLGTQRWMRQTARLCRVKEHRGQATR
jgi:hypothetical protein